MATSTRRRRSGHAFVISAPSGGGKTTVVARLRRHLPRLRRSISVTTRAPRPGERQGRDYRFVSPAVFDRLRRSGALVEWAEVHGAKYGTPKRPLTDALARGQDMLLSVDVQGARHLRSTLGSRAVLIFLAPPSMERLRQRLIQRRTDAAAAIRRRLVTATREMACASWYDYTVVNNRLASTITRVRSIIAQARRRETQSAASEMWRRRYEQKGAARSWRKCRSKNC